MRLCVVDRRVDRGLNQFLKRKQQRKHETDDEKHGINARPIRTENEQRKKAEQPKISDCRLYSLLSVGTRRLRHLLPPKHCATEVISSRSPDLTDTVGSAR